MITFGIDPHKRTHTAVAMSRGRLSNQLYHGPAPDHSGALHHHVRLDGDEVASLTSRLHHTRSEMPVSPDLSEIAAVWQQVDAEIAAIDHHRRLELLRYRDPLEHEQASLRGEVERLQRRVEQKGSDLPAP